MRQQVVYKRLLLLLLCLLCLLTASGCEKKTVDEVETTPQAEMVNQEALPVLSEVTETAVQTETTEINSTEPLVTETAHIQETEYTETAVLDEQILEGEPTVLSEDTVLKSQYTQLQDEYNKTKRFMIIFLVVAVLMLVVAAISVSFWRKNAKLLKKQRREKLGIEYPISTIAVGKVHGIGQRNTQQDSFSISPVENYQDVGILAVVADGMGGLTDGDKASQSAVVAAMEAFWTAEEFGKNRLVQILAAAKQGVDLSVAASSGESGTTILLGLVQNGMFYHVSVGDSQIALYRRGVLLNLNREHVYADDLLRNVVNGEIMLNDAVTNEKGGCITSFLGMDRIPYIDIPTEGIPLCVGDKIIMMSDGVYNALSQRELCLALQHTAQDAADAIDSFIGTKSYPDQDNYTAVILECL